MMWFLAPLVFLVQGVQWMEWHGSDDQGYWHKYENYQPDRAAVASGKTGMSGANG